jgi:hypothetical protein
MPKVIALAAGYKHRATAKRGSLAKAVSMTRRDPARRFTNAQHASVFQCFRTHLLLIGG